jgi:hypothetical protein
LIETKNEYLSWITVSEKERFVKESDSPREVPIGKHDSDDENDSDNDYIEVIYEEESPLSTSSSLSMLSAYNDPIHGRIIRCQEILCKIGDRCHSFPLKSDIAVNI